MALPVNSGSVFWSGVAVSRAVAASSGSQRALAGAPHEDSEAEARFLSAADLTGSQRAKISHANAERVFAIKPPPAITIRRRECSALRR